MKKLMKLNKLALIAIVISTTYTSVSYTIFGFGRENRENAANKQLLEAALYGDENAIVPALEEGADIDTRDKDDWTPLMLAVRSYTRNHRAAETLLQKGADVNATSKKGDTALGLAVVKPDDYLVDLLLQNGANPNASARWGREHHVGTVLMAAAHDGRVHRVALLVEKGAEVNAQNAEGLTALMVAVQNEIGVNPVIITEFLLEHGADVYSIKKALAIATQGTRVESLEPGPPSPALVSLLQNAIDKESLEKE